jgi:hypothetical protein
MFLIYTAVGEMSREKPKKSHFFFKNSRFFLESPEKNALSPFSGRRHFVFFRIFFSWR